MGSKNNKPNIRFDGFSDDWTQQKLFQIININSGRDYKHLNTGNIPVYGTGGHMLNVDEALSEIDSIGIGRKGTIDQPYLLRAPFWTVDTLFFATPKNKKSLLFLLNLFRSIPWKRFDESTGVPSLSKNLINNIDVFIPNNKEQIRIGDLFQELEKITTLHQHKLNNLETLKKTFLDKLFPKNNETKPLYRFNGFANDWQQCKLRKIVDISTGKLDANAMKKNGKYDFYTSGTQKYRINNFAFFGPAITIAGNGATVGYMHFADGKFNAYQRTYVLTNLNADRYYLYYEISNKLPRKIAEEARTGNIPYIVMEMLTDLLISLPISKEEESNVGLIFKELDTIITLYQQKLKHLKTMKKYFLNNMFI